jgi:predicted nuclease with TOPRIM domain
MPAVDKSTFDTHYASLEAEGRRLDAKLKRLHAESARVVAERYTLLAEQNTLADQWRELNAMLQARLQS